MQHVLFGCGAGGGCSCGQGFGAARHRRYPHIEGALKSYIAQQLADNSFFYLTPDLNSASIGSTTHGGGSGFGAVTIDAGGTLDDAISTLATSLGDSLAAGWGNSAPDPFSYSTTINSGPVGNLPEPLRAPVTQAGAADLFGIPVADWLVGGAGLLLLVVLLTMVPHRGGAPARRRRRR